MIEPWDRPDWFSAGLRKLIYLLLLDVRGLPFTLTLAVTLYKFWQTGQVPDGAVSLMLVMAGVFSGTYVATKAVEVMKERLGEK